MEKRKEICPIKVWCITIFPNFSQGTAYTALPGTEKLGLCLRVRARKLTLSLYFHKHSNNSTDKVQILFPQAATERGESWSLSFVIVVIKRNQALKGQAAQSLVTQLYLFSIY